ncbi:MAG: helix-turn-helix domain-containing protein [Paludibacter sp.]|nr:helix-turn-helix domain-containing protein [Paludibacter sp.]
MNTVIGKKIRTLRENRGFSQEQMADRLNISRSAYSRIETGESNSWASNLDKICLELNIKPEELFSSDGLVQHNSDMSSAVQNHTQRDTHIIFNHLSDKLIELYEDKIKRLEAEIEQLKKSV